jgi:protein-S-isoprenylcysteine O-methyltransferase Ste14
MPVIMSPEDYELGLEPEFHGQEKLLETLRPYPAEEMEAYPVSTVVKNPRNKTKMFSGNQRSQQSVRINPWRLAPGYALGFLVFLALFVLLPAGTFEWKKGWVFIGVFLVLMAATAVYLWRVNPEIYVARRRFHKGTKRWDAILLLFLFSAMFAIFVVAALDDARFHWTPVPGAVVGVGYILLVFGIGFTVWAQSFNRFFEPGVRIQTDRGHRVIDTGPYAILRHPGYAASIPMFAGVALCLGSLWALIPAGASSLLMILRTKWEDETLQAELPGYKEYTQRVRFKLIPGVW